MRSSPRRSRWSEGRGPRGMRTSKARAGRRAGRACHRRWIAYGKSQGKGRRRGSPRSCTTSASSCWGGVLLALREDAAAGVDGVTWRDYEQDLARKLEDLHARVHRGAYRALPVRRRFIPKPDGGQRPLGIAALEDKIVQRAVVELLNAIYEEDFLGFSYGFRPGRGPHDALDALVVGHRTQEGELDTGRRHPVVLRLDQPRMADPLPGAPDRRPAHHPPDPQMAEGGRSGRRGSAATSETGTPQGAVISPLLANIYLHYVLDLWAEQWRRREATGDMIIVRYADDIVVGFEHEADARRFLDGLRARMAEFALTLHPEKTRLIEFGRFAARTPRAHAGWASRRPSTSWASPSSAARSRSGRFLVKRKTRRDRMRTKLEDAG